MKTAAGKKRSREEAAGSAGGSTPPVSPPRPNPNKEWNKSKAKTEDLLALLSSGFIWEKEVREVLEYDYKQLAYECDKHMELEIASDRDLVNCYKSPQKLNKDCEKLWGQLKELKKLHFPSQGCWCLIRAGGRLLHWLTG
jgi:hypothetical protein